MDIARPFVIAFLLGFGAFFTIEVFFTKMDQNTQAYAADAIEKFVDDACTSGYISPSSYLEMTRRINNTGNLYNLLLVHEAKVVMPYVAADGSEIEGNFVVSNATYNKEEILDEMFPVSSADYFNYVLGNGDYVKVSLSLKEPTMAGKLMARISGHEPRTIVYSYGGYVGNTEENGMEK